MNLFKYIRRAFLDKWNLLAFLGGLGLAALSDRYDVILPIVLACETAYLGLLATHPRYQKYVLAQEAAEQRKSNSQSAAQALRQITQMLPPSALSRFESLRTRCQELRQIARDLHATQDSAGGLDSLQLQSFDRLLWLFLRLLFTQYSLSRFLQRTSVEKIQEDLRQVEQRLKALSADDDSPFTQKARKTLEDNLQTCRDRLLNYQKAKSNFDLVGLEVDRLENKIKSLAELAVNRQEPDFISSQVDLVANSMLETEKTINELQFATGLAPIDEGVPEFVTPPTVRTTR